MPNREEVLARIEATGAVAVIRLDDGNRLVQVAKALLSGGLDCIEFTMTTPGALQLIERVAQQFGDRILVGAGTVLDPEMADAVILAGAHFVVGPNLSIPTIQLCRRRDVMVVPGTFTPTEIHSAWQAGADMIKVFPAQVGGPRYIRAILAPLPQVKLMPTGGVTLQNAAHFIKAGAVAVGLGSALVDKATVQEGHFEVLTERATQLVAAIQRARA